jgi:hypothetical protein
MSPALGNALRTVAQALAVLCMAFILGMVAHKGHADISVMAQKYSGQAFWTELARYFIGNLGGGGRPGPAPNTPPDK